MGESLLSNLEYKSFSDFASDLLGPWAGYFTGWTYWFCWVVTGMADVVAITAYAHLVPRSPHRVASLAVIVLLLTLNLATVKMFGDMDILVCDDQIVAIVSLIVVGLVMVAMHFQSPTGVEASFAHLWNDGGWFPKNFISGFFAGSQIVVFAFVGIELVGTTAAETKDPEKSLPRAINSIPIRIIMFYVFALIVIMSVTPWSFR